MGQSQLFNQVVITLQNTDDVLIVGQETRSGEPPRSADVDDHVDGKACDRVRLVQRSFVMESRLGPRTAKEYRVVCQVTGDIAGRRLPAAAWVSCAVATSREHPLSR